jgi:hypothetical protein
MTETTMAKQEISPRMRQHLQELADRHGDSSAVPPSAPPRPQPGKLRRPMSGPINVYAVYVDGALSGGPPPDWSKPKQPPLATTQSAPLSEEEERAERREWKARELAERMQRWNRPDRRPQRPPLKPLSPAVRDHLLKSLARSEI